MAQGKRLENCRAEHNLNAPAYTRYKDWAVGLASGDLGTSIKRSKPLEEIIGPRFRNTVILGLTAALVGIPLAIVLEPWPHCIAIDGRIFGSHRSRFFV